MVKKIHSLEVKALEGEMDFDDARGLHSGSENVLLCGLVVSGAEPVQVVQETANKQTGNNLVINLHKNQFVI
jgi:hypothetical protein